MFKIVLISTLLAFASAASYAVGDERSAEVRSLDNNPADAEGNYAYSFETSNGIATQESGNAAGVTGSVKYVSADGVPVELVYTADLDGFHPSGVHLPTPPPVPEYVLRALAYIDAHPSEQNRSPVQPQYQAQPQYKAPVPRVQPVQYKPQPFGKPSRFQG